MVGMSTPTTIGGIGLVSLDFASATRGSDIPGFCWKIAGSKRTTCAELKMSVVNVWIPIAVAGDYDGYQSRAWKLPQQIHGQAAAWIHRAPGRYLNGDSKRVLYLEAEREWVESAPLSSTQPPHCRLGMGQRCLRPPGWQSKSCLAACICSRPHQKLEGYCRHHQSLDEKNTSAPKSNKG